MDAQWQHHFTSTWPTLVSQLGFEVRRAGSLFDLYRPVGDQRVWIGRFDSSAKAREAADRVSCQERRDESGTGSPDHVLVEGRGGRWDVDVARRFALGQEPVQLSRLREISDTLPDGPSLCVPLELISDGAYVLREYLLVGADRARAQVRATGHFEAVYLSFAAAEVARVPDENDLAVARVGRRQYLRDCLRPVRLGPWAAPAARASGDLAARVREYLSGRGEAEDHPGSTGGVTVPEAGRASAPTVP